MTSRSSLSGAVLTVFAVVVGALVLRHRVTDRTPPARPPHAVPAHGAIAHVPPPAPADGAAPTTFESRLLAAAAPPCRPDETAAALKGLCREDPERLFHALLALAQAPLAVRQRAIPALADALSLWPEAEGRFVFPIADAYAELDVTAAAEWASRFLNATGRDDLAAATIVARLAETSEDRALTLIAELPDSARPGALRTLAYHLPLTDLDHLLDVCQRADPNGTTSFSRQLFERLGAERLDAASAWLAANSDAQRVPGAVRAIAQALVNAGDPRRAITWADALPDGLVRAQAITGVYQAWAHHSPDGAIQDILAAYDGAPVLMADVFKGAAEHHGSGATEHWATACNLQNPSARAYAVSALIKPMLLTVGPGETQARISALPAGSLERTVADQVYQATLRDPEVATQLRARASDPVGPTAN